MVHRRPRARLFGPLAAIGAVFLVAGSATAGYPYIRQASGTYTTTQNAALVSFDSKAYADGTTKGKIDFYLGETSIGPIRIVGTAACSGTVDSTSAWTIYAATNNGSQENPSFAYLQLWYRDGGKSNDGAVGFVDFDITAGCEATGAQNVADFAAIPDGPRTISGGNITIK